MITFKKQYEVLWADIDANRHMIHTSYGAYMAHTRLSCLTSQGLDVHMVRNLGIGPVLLNEQIHYIGEVMPSEIITVTAEIGGLSSDYKFLIFTHSLFKENNKIAAYGEVLITWIDQQTRKIAEIPEAWKHILDSIKKSENFKEINPADTRFAHVPYKKVLED